MTRALVDLKGRYFGRLHVIELSAMTKRGAMWLCVCSCGERRVVLGVSLTSGGTRSCGCLRAQASQRRMLTM
jgi:hypothetical protein